MIYKKIYAWREALQAKPFIGIDEHGITNAYALTVFDKINIKYKLHIGNQLTRLITSWKKRKLYMHEQFTTPFSPIPWIDGSINSKQPDEWYYIDGNITNSRDKDRKFIYLHFMNFKSSKWRHDKTIAPWENKEKIVFVSAQDMVKGIKINRQGFLPI